MKTINQPLHFLLFLLMLFVPCSCISFNTGAKLDSIGKAVPSLRTDDNKKYYRLNGVVYREVMVSYVQQNPHLIGTGFMGYWDLGDGDTPADAATNAPRPQLYLVRMQADRPDMPAFIPASHFDYSRAQKIAANEDVPRVIPLAYFKKHDWLTLTPSQNDRNRHLSDLPTIRTTGNKIRVPLAVVLSYGVDAPLTAVGYTVGALWHIFVIPFMLI